MDMLSWIRRCNVLKMNVLPRVLYLSQTLPLKTWRSFFTKLPHCFPNLCGLGKQREWAWRYWQRRTGNPGLKYYVTSHCVRAIKWCRHMDHKQWVRMEHQQSWRPLNSLIWCRRPLPEELMTHLTTLWLIEILKAFLGLSWKRELWHNIPHPWCQLGAIRVLYQGRIADG